MRLFATLLLIALVHAAQTFPHEEARTRQTTPAASGQNEEANKANRANTTHTSTTQQRSAETLEGSTNRFDKNLHRAYELATILGVLGGLFGLYYIWQQSTHTERAAKAAQESSDAALMNAKAIINAERPWMFIEIDAGAYRAVAAGDIPSDVWFSVRFRNHGKTPAEIVGFDHHPDIRNSCDDLPIPPEYSMEGEVMVHTRMVPAGGVWEYPESRFVPTNIFMAEQWEEVRSSRRRLIYWGRLQYRDLVEESRTIHELKRDKPITIHETCFCYFWSPRLNEFFVCGPLGYNKHT